MTMLRLKQPVALEQFGRMNLPGISIAALVAYLSPIFSAT
jgi:hypothetical protein